VHQGERAELEAQLSREREAKIEATHGAEVLKGQVETLARLLRRQRRAAESRAHEELEQLRLQYVAREERYVLDGEREQLSAIKRELDGLRSQAVYGAAAADASAAVARAAHAAHDGAFAQASSVVGAAPAWMSPVAPASPVAGEGQQLYGFVSGTEVSPMVAPQPRPPPPAPGAMPPRSPASAAAEYGSSAELFRLQVRGGNGRLLALPSPFY
jgi:hypothetical protein